MRWRPALDASMLDGNGFRWHDPYMFLALGAGFEDSGVAREADWLQDMPRSLRHRFDGLGNYVLAVLDDERLRDSLKQEAIQRIQILAFLKMLQDFFREGSQAAMRAVDAFAELGVKSFQIGSEAFEGRNSSVTRGDRLADGVREAIADPAIVQVLNTEGTLRELIVRLGREATRG